jgi:hypothetical protein
MNPDRSPTVSEDASAFKPTASPAIEIEEVAICTLKKIPSEIIP